MCTFAILIRSLSLRTTIHIVKCIHSTLHFKAIVALCFSCDNGVCYACVRRGLSEKASKRNSSIFIYALPYKSPFYRCSFVCQLKTIIVIRLHFHTSIFVQCSYTYFVYVFTIHHSFVLLFIFRTLYIMWR